MSLLNFDTHVNFLSRARNGEEFFNSGPEKASIVISALFRTAKKSIDIFSGSLDEKVYTKDMFAHLLDEPEIQPDKIRVVVTEPNSVNKDLLSYFHDNGIELRYHGDIGGHLIVADGDCYRFEHDHEDKKAYFAFGTKNGTNSILPKLRKAFEKIWERAELVNRP